jgi:hypothetical protein
MQLRWYEVSCFRMAAPWHGSYDISGKPAADSMRKTRSVRDPRLCLVMILRTFLLEVAVFMCP